MIVYIKDRRKKFLNWIQECSNCGAHAIERERKTPVRIPIGDSGHNYEITTEIVCPYGCIDEERVV